MPDSMFDKLGELISEGFESGNFFGRSKKPAESSAAGPAPNGDTGTASEQAHKQEKRGKRTSLSSIKTNSKRFT